MFGKKRKRDDSWDTFVDTIRTMIEQKYEEVNTIQTSPLSVQLIMSHSSRIPLSLFDDLEYENYDSSVNIKPITNKGTKRLEINIDYKICKIVKKLGQETSVYLQSPKQFMENSLRLKNEEVIQMVENIIDEAKLIFAREMNWNNAPYTIISYKKHKQIIVRFRFLSTHVSWNLHDKINNLKNSFLEYNKKKEKLFLVTILDNCI